ncbi:hypothetical protein L1049_011459 [Liquidambar formosana]|uniref:RNase H type-1 domain-containing protein n=1 Tax=Liquidambar formosana TaxID=63359 RepID=A0AAP0X290_LIQFO
MISGRYGSAEGFSLLGAGSNRKISVLWNDIVKVWSSESYLGTHLQDGIGVLLGDGEKAKFWLDCWATDVPLKDVFPRLFSLATIRKSSVQDMGFWNEGLWHWDVKFRRNLYEWESILYQSLLSRLKDVRLCECFPDKFIWKYSPSGLYSVKSCYDAIVDRALPSPDDSWGLIWKAKRRTAIWVKALRSELGYSIDEFLNCIDGVRQFHIKKKKQKRTIIWYPPSPGTLKFNVDGLARGKPGPGGIGGVLRDEHGRILCVFSAPIGSVDSNFAELLAVREALRLFSASVWVSSSHLLIESNSSLVVSWINSRSRIWKFNFAINEIYSLIDRLQVVEIRYEFREANYRLNFSSADLVASFRFISAKFLGVSLPRVGYFFC